MVELESIGQRHRLAMKKGTENNPALALGDGQYLFYDSTWVRKLFILNVWRVNRRGIKGANALHWRIKVIEGVFLNQRSDLG